MFSSSDIEALFTDTNRSLQRSMLLLDEHAPAGGLSSPSSLPAMPSLSPTTSGGLGGIAVVQSLRGLGQLRVFVEAAAGVAEKLGQEAAAPSPAMARQRQKGVVCPVLRRTVAGLRVEQLWSRSREASRLWWDPALGSTGEPGDGGGAGGGEVTGARVAGLLLMAALCADLCHCGGEGLRLVRCWADRPAPADAAVLSLLASASQAGGAGLPPAVVTTVVLRLSELLVRMCPPRPLSAGMLLVPGWASFVVSRGDPALVALLLLRPLSCASGELLSLYRRDEELFGLACRQCLAYACAVAAQLLTAPPAAAAAAADEDPRRLLATLQRLVDALVLPLEERFTADVARPGMARALLAELVAPFAAQGKPALLAMAAARGAAAPRLASLLHTAHYRLLLLVETVGRAELSRETGGGAGHAATQQKRYGSLLKQSQGKITINLLCAIAEDRQLVLEEGESRSASGHAIHRLHDGSEDTSRPAVYLYVDNGSVLYKVGRARQFTTAKSVEEIFKSF